MKLKACLDGGFEREYFEGLTMSTFWYIYLRFKIYIYIYMTDGRIIFKSRLIYF